MKDPLIVTLRVESKQMGVFLTSIGGDEHINFLGAVPEKLTTSPRDYSAFHSTRPKKSKPTKPRTNNPVANGPAIVLKAIGDGLTDITSIRKHYVAAGYNENGASAQISMLKKVGAVEQVGKGIYKLSKPST